MLSLFRKMPMVLATLSLLGLVTACSSNSENTDPIKVFAAASINVAGEDLAEAFEEPVEWNFAGSSALARQIEQGAPADVLISADEANMAQALKLPEFSNAKPRVIATNQLVLAIAENNPANIKSLNDIHNAQVALCAKSVPCGTLAHKLVDDEDLVLSNPSEEANVSDVSTKVATGQVDAGFIYESDAQAIKNSGTQITVLKLAGVEKNRYPAATTDNATANAAKFLDWLESPEAQKILRDYGFGPGA